MLEKIKKFFLGRIKVEIGWFQGEMPGFVVGIAEKGAGIFTIVNIKIVKFVVSLYVGVI